MKCESERAKNHCPVASWKRKLVWFVIVTSLEILEADIDEAYGLSPLQQLKDYFIIRNL